MPVEFLGRKPALDWPNLFSSKNHKHYVLCRLCLGVCTNPKFEISGQESGFSVYLFVCLFVRLFVYLFIYFFASSFFLSPSRSLFLFLLQVLTFYLACFQFQELPSLRAGSALSLARERRRTTQYSGKESREEAQFSARGFATPF